MQNTSALELRRKLLEPAEIALIDVREQGVFAKCHLLLASCIPLSRLELRFAELVPRLDTHIVLCDAGPVGAENTAWCAAERLESFGYGNVAVLEGGIDGWNNAGFELFNGINVPSKAFGEFVERTYDTPRITAADLRARQASGDDLVILDSRPFSEYHRMSIPGGINTPGAELVYRLHDLAPDANTDIVVNCAGRTRSIIGTQSLINAGIPNRVMALKDGTMGWQLAGYDVDRGAEQKASLPSSDSVDTALRRAKNVGERFGVRYMTHRELDELKRDTVRTVYLLDVRTPEEFVASHLPGSRSAPGGQLVQATDEYIVVRNATVVLIDHTQIRAIMTASWLVQMGWTEVFVLKDAFENQDLVTEPYKPPLLGFSPAETLTAFELKAALDSGESVRVLDFADSLSFRKSHIPNAQWAIRPDIEATLTLMPPTGLLVITSPDGILAHYAANDIADLRPNQLVRVLQGGNNAWVEAGFSCDSGFKDAADTDINPDADDVWYKPYDHPDAAQRRMQDYLDWEVALVDQLERDGTLRFKRYV